MGDVIDKPKPKDSDDLLKWALGGAPDLEPDIDPKELEKMALEAVADRLGGKEPRKVIVKAPKIVSIVPAE